MFLGSPSCVCMFDVRRLCWRDLCLSAVERKTFVSHAELKFSVHHNLLPSSGFTRREEPQQEGWGHSGWGGVRLEGSPVRGGSGWRGHQGGAGSGWWGLQGGAGSGQGTAIHPKWRIWDSLGEEPGEPGEKLRRHMENMGAPHRAALTELEPAPFVLRGHC